MLTRLKVLAVVASGSLTFAVAVPAAAQDCPIAETTLTFADSFPLTHDYSREGMVYWMERAEDLSGGKIRFTHYPAEQLVKATSILEAIGARTVDAGYVSNGYYSDVLPLNGFADLPGLIGSSKEGSHLYWEMINTDGPLRQEFLAANVVPMAYVTAPPYQLVLSLPPLQGLDELRGKTIRSAGGVQALTVEALGATPASMAGPEIYLGMQRGTIDGTLLASMSMLPYKLQEVAKSLSHGLPLGSPAVGIAINQEVYNCLAPELQQALKQAGTDTVEHLSSYLDERIATAESELATAGVAVYAPNEEITREIEERISHVAVSWVERLAARGLPAQDVLAEFRAKKAATSQ